jgi:hypothetical protein
LPLQDFEGVIRRFARVDDHRKAQFGGEVDLSGKDSALDIARREVVVVVQSHLAERDCLAPVRRIARGLGRIGRTALERAGAVRMNSRSKADARPRLLHHFRPGDLVRFIRGKNANGRIDASRLCARRNLGQVWRESGVRQVTVGIDQRTRVPGAGGVSKLTSRGFPPSGLAASTMPLDSMPINFAGFRFATMAT